MAQRTVLSEVTLPIEKADPRKDPKTALSYIDIGAIDQAHKVVNSPTRILGADAPSRARQVLEPGDVLVSTVRPNLNAVALVEEQHKGAIGSTGFCVLRADPARLDSSYLFHWVQTRMFVDDMVSQASGASYPAVSDRIVKASFLRLPSIEEQRRIAAILDAADALRAKRRQALAKLDSLTQAIFIDMFGDVSPANLTLDRLADTTAGHTWKSQRFSEEPVGLPLVRIQNVGIPHSRCVYWPDEYSDKYLVHNGDILLSLSGSFRVAQWHGGDALLNQRILRIDPREGVDKTWLLAALSIRIEEVASMGRDAVISNVSIRDVRGLRLPSVSQVAQSEFASRVSRAEETHGAMARAGIEFDTLFSALQQRAFRGEL